MALSRRNDFEETAAAFTFATVAAGGSNPALAVALGFELAEAFFAEVERRSAATVQPTTQEETANDSRT